jgi:long-subunit acyl-CoA synthetase (AMP-forming)
MDKWMTDFAFDTKFTNFKENASDLQHLFYDNFVFKEFRDIIGGNVRMAVCSGASIYPHVLDFLKVIFGIPILEV